MEYVLFSGLAHGVLLVIRKNHHVLSSISEMLDEVSGHVADVIDAPPQLAALAKVVDANQQTFPAPCALGVAICVALRCSLTQTWRPSRRPEGTATIFIGRRCERALLEFSIRQKKKRQSSRITHKVLFVGLLVARNRKSVAGKLLVAGDGVSAQPRQLSKDRKPCACV